MSNLGFLSIYQLLNGLDSCLCERAFLPADLELNEHLRTNTPLFSLESQRPLAEFDILAFSISFEDDYLNIPRLLRLARIPGFSVERPASQPFIMAGGVAVSMNPEPIAEFIDLFAIGEGEVFVPSFIDAFEKLRHESKTKTDLLEGLSEQDGVYVPSFYEIDYDGDKIATFIPKKGAPKRIRKVLTQDLDSFVMPVSSITTPETEFSNVSLMEVERGCGRGCRFCSAGFVYLPPRERKVSTIKEGIRKGLARTGKVGLIGAAISEYSGIKDALKFVNKECGEVTLSSLRLDVLDGEMLNLLKDGGYETVTLAPETGSERLRDVLNKGISDQNIMDAIYLIQASGFFRLKLYFMVGLPTENEEDISAIIDLVMRIRGVFKKGGITLSINPFIPKPWTPFQWHPYEDIKILKKKFVSLRKGLSGIKGVDINIYSAKEGYNQAFLSRGDRRVAGLIREVIDVGWVSALRNNSINQYKSVYRERGKNEALPWSFIDHGINEGYLWSEYQNALNSRLTPPCNIGVCKRCGVCT